MSAFTSGRVGGLRFRVQNGSTTFGPEHLSALSDSAIGSQRVAMGDGSQIGWIAGDHILDKDFTLEKCVVNGTLQFALRVDETRPPASLLKAYADQELRGLMAENPSGTPSKKQRREARSLAKERIEQEAKDGRFLRRKSFSVLWDGDTGELLFGSASMNTLDRLHSLFKQTFDKTLEFLGAGNRASEIDEQINLAGATENVTPTEFVSTHNKELAWIGDETNRDYLGNEFLLWLWHFTECISDTIKLRDDSEVTFMVARNLDLECPRGQNGKESVRSDAPGRLPESKRAAQAGKLPRKAGLTLVRHDLVYELTLQAETFALSGAKLPKREEGTDRVDLIRSMFETLDLLYEAFLVRRVDSAWSDEANKIRKWLGATV